MKIVKRGQMPDGTNIQIEDWKESYSFIKTLIIGTYPKAKNTSISGYIVKNETFRLELSSFESDEQVENVFKELEEGKISLEDLSEYFREGQKDKFYLGLVDCEEIVQNKDIEMKTLKDWQNSKATTFDDFFIPGDIVGEDVVKHFRNVQIPITDNAYLMQMGEAQDCTDGKTTYMTFSKEPKGWIYRGDCYKGETKSPFEKWLDTFIEEKEIDIEEEFKSTNGSISVFFSYSDIINTIKITSKDEQSEIKNMLVTIDYKNGDIKDYLRHLSKALIPTNENMEETYSLFNQEVIINPILHFKGEIIPGVNENEIYRQIKSYLNEYLVQSDLDTDIINVQLVGSRTKGKFNENSDIDVLVEYNNSELREDDLFNRIK